MQLLARLVRRHKQQAKGIPSHIGQRCFMRREVCHWQYGKQGRQRQMEINVVK